MLLSSTQSVSICMPVIVILVQVVLQLLCSQGCLTIQNAKVGKEIIQANIYRILPTFNQIIYTLDTICMPNIMILAQAVFQTFCSQCLLWVKCLSMKRGLIQSNIHRILRKVNQAIYTIPDIVILAQ